MESNQVCGCWTLHRGLQQPPSCASIVLVLIPAHEGTGIMLLLSAAIINFRIDILTLVSTSIFSLSQRFRHDGDGDGKADDHSYIHQHSPRITVMS